MAEETRKQRFITFFMGVWATFYPDKEPNELMINSYYRAMENLDINDIESAFNRAVVTLKWFPRPVELISMITGSNGDIESTATKEATKVLQAIRSVGGYKSVQFDDPVTNAVILRGFSGWDRLCNDRIERDNKWFLKDFIEIYKSYHATGIKHYGYLPGIHAGGNDARGFKSLPPVTVSDSILIGHDEPLKIPDKTGFSTKERQ